MHSSGPSPDIVGYDDASMTDQHQPGAARSGGGRGGSRVGERIAHYEIVAHLGAGGMGEVYRARDSKLGRDVAIKVLPDVHLTDPDRSSRFEREARVLASISHPHIGAIYGVEQAPGLRALVLELVDGQTLAARLADGPLPTHEALLVARQIAEALEAAHEKGIIHRDLKPANIMFTAAGTVKVLDFGLAKLIDSDGSVPGLMQSPTLTAAGTVNGIILGTAAYLSPEQARGRTLDKRADVWAFGCVLYEMLTGRAAFARETISDTISAILTQEPDWSALPADLPPAVTRLLHRCLAKDARHRLHDIADARLDLDEILASPASRRASDNGNARWPIASPTRSLDGTPAVDSPCIDRPGARRRLRCRDSLLHAPRRVGRARAVHARAARTSQLFGGGKLLCHLPGWPLLGVCRHQRADRHGVGSADRLARCSTAKRNRRRATGVLVSRQPVHRVLLRRRLHQEGRRHRRTATNTGNRHGDSNGRDLEPRRRDSVFLARVADSALAGRRQ